VIAGDIGSGVAKAVANWAGRDMNVAGMIGSGAASQAYNATVKAGREVALKKETIRAEQAAAHQAAQRSSAATFANTAPVLEASELAPLEMSGLAEAISKLPDVTPAATPDLELVTGGKISNLTQAFTKFYGQAPSADDLIRLAQYNMLSHPDQVSADRVLNAPADLEQFRQISVSAENHDWYVGEIKRSAEMRAALANPQTVVTTDGITVGDLQLLDRAFKLNEQEAAKPAYNQSLRAPVSVSANTNASAMGITDAQVDAAIARGETGVWDAVSYAARVTGYKAWNFVTGGFVERQDARIIANASGQLSDADFWKATTIDAGVSVGSIVAAGRVGGYVAGRVGNGYLGSALSGAAVGGILDLGFQGGQNAVYLATNGQAGSSGFSGGEFATATALGGAFGVGGKYFSEYGHYNVQLRYPEPGVLYSTPSVFKLVAPESPAAYSVAFETKLDVADFGRSRDVHFNRANAALDAALKADTEYAVLMESLIPNVESSVSSIGGRATPTGWTWEHASSSTAGGQLGVMRLVPTSQHTPGSAFWRVLHPNRGAAGGYSEWAIPNGAPKN
jgi:hypothetical protein